LKRTDGGYPLDETALSRRNCTRKITRKKIKDTPYQCLIILHRNYEANVLLTAKMIII